MAAGWMLGLAAGLWGAAPAHAAAPPAARTAARPAARSATRSAARTAAILPVALPDSGRFTFFYGGTAAGGDSFTIAREDGGIVARQTGTIQIGASFTFADTTRITLHEDLQLHEYTTRTVANGQRVDVRIAFEPGRAVVETHPDSAGAPRDTTAFAAGAVLIPNNTLVAFPLVYMTAVRRGLSRSDVTLPLYGSSTCTITRGVPERRGALRTWRFAFNIARTIGGSMWVDDRGRLVKVAFPLQNAELVRDGVDGAASLGDTTRPESPPDVGGHWSEEVRLLSGGTPLGGTLLLPRRSPAPRVPAVLLLTGSGAQDRNEDTPGKGGIHFGIFRTIAERLAARGIATLRLDDRGVGASGGDFNTSTFRDAVADAQAALRFLRGRPEIDARRVALLGHSEGAMIAMLIAGQDSHLAAAGLMAGPIQPFADVIMAQTLAAARNAGATPEHLRETARAESTFLAVLARRGAWTTATVPPEAMAMQSRRIWLEELVALDLTPSVKAIRCPVGIFQGGRDDQVAPHDAVVIDSLLARTGKARHALHVFPRLNHLFIESRGGGIAEYAAADATIDETFLRALVRWSVATLRPPRAGTGTPARSAQPGRGRGSPLGAGRESW